MGKITKSKDAFLSLNVNDDKKKRSVIKNNKEGTRISRRRRNVEALASTRGLIYVGHIPHGFYEEEMKEYFSQFGRVTNVKVCRSKISGKSKGYGFIEFSTPEVANIAAETMNNYLMFKKRVVALFIPYEKRPPFLFNSFVPKKLLPGKFRRERHVLSKNKRLDDSAILRKKTLVISRLKSKLEKLKKRGIECEIQPLD
ncbi:MKI67 FHA domain-interacting nucleolar phosphoprotein-like [Coccinella septempunctata]|uniref:MKI67 FHA domain-interacting nucleolar phosphoprotein-like n=1 Tax=Coccinella septempunctata TaxID=41139 RepID=UPI001D087E01|nr:MKI67 FHA domain-interacting nucleolar phosphoprotein-like [Coccinella septempunctata]